MSKVEFPVSNRGRKLLAAIGALSVADQNKNEKSTPHQVLKCQTIGTTSNVSSTPVSRNLVKSFVSSKFVSRHPVLRKPDEEILGAEIFMFVLHNQKVHPQRHYLQRVSTRNFLSPRKVLSVFVTELRRKRHASTCRKLSNLASRKNYDLKAGRPGMLRDFDGVVPPKPEIPQHLGSPCLQLNNQGFTRTH